MPEPLAPCIIERRIRAAWLGKNIGGTLGAPFEGKPGLLDLAYYDPVPTAALPNDDLDLQIVWLHHLRSTGARAVTPDLLAGAWRKHVRWPPDEYGIVRRNDAYGLQGADRGAFDNYFAECMGAAIRSELWACLAPGDPNRAAALAWNDAVVDHCGDGVYAEMFHAAMQAAAFRTADVGKLVEIGMEFIPEGSRLRRALGDVLGWWRPGGDWRAIRRRILERYGTGNFTDVVGNLCFEVLALLAGEGDFGRSICLAVNCGLDTDCTAATVGALLGIMDPDSISPRWLDPIGERIVISDLIVGVDVPADLEELTAWTMALARQLEGVEAVPGPTVPRMTEGERGSQTLEILGSASCRGDVSLLDRESPPSDLDGEPVRWNGHWQQLRREEFADELRIFELTFRLDHGSAVCVMAFCSSGASAWVDDRRVIAYTERDVRSDPLIAPSLHRSHCTRMDFTDGALKPGDHRLVVACRRPLEAAADLIVGVGSVVDRFWYPYALAREVSGQR